MTQAPNATRTALQALQATKMILATDLDGTFLGGTPAARRALYDWIEAQRHDVGLIFVTGRDPHAIARFCAQDGVPMPSHVVGDVGTTIAEFDGAELRPIPALEAEIAEAWADGAALHALIEPLPGLRLQDTPFRYRLSYHYDAALFDPASLEPIRARGYDVLISHGCYVDILPRGISKGPSLMRLLAHLGLDQDSVLVAGDTLNDLSMFQTGLRGAVVGGSEEGLLRAVADLPRAHRCTAIGAAGIIEAIHAHGLHPAPPEIPA